VFSRSSVSRARGSATEPDGARCEVPPGRGQSGGEFNRAGDGGGRARSPERRSGGLVHRDRGNEECRICRPRDSSMTKKKTNKMPPSQDPLVFGRPTDPPRSCRAPAIPACSNLGYRPRSRPFDFIYTVRHRVIPGFVTPPVSGG